MTALGAEGGKAPFTYLSFSLYLLEKPQPDFSHQLIFLRIPDHIDQTCNFKISHNTVLPRHRLRDPITNRQDPRCRFQVFAVFQPTFPPTYVSSSLPVCQPTFLPIYLSSILPFFQRASESWTPTAKTPLPRECEIMLTMSIGRSSTRSSGP